MDTRESQRGVVATSIVRSVWLFLCLVLAAGVIAVAPSASADEATSPAEVASEAISHAWTFYWSGLLDGGDLRGFDRGLNYAERAERALAEIGEGDPRRAALAAQHAEIEETLRRQRALAAQTLRGQFPLTALLRKSLLLNSRALGNYELIDDPDDVATTALVEDLRDGVLSKWGAMPQTDVTVVSLLPDRALEDKVLSLLSTTPRINLRPIADVARSLPAPVVEKIRRGEALEVGEQARQQFGASRFIVVIIKRVDVVEDVHAVELAAQVFSGGEPGTFSILGVTHDRRGQLPVLIVTILVCFLIGLGLVWWLTRERLTREETLALATLAFVGGLGIPNALMGLVGGFEPPGNELAQLSFWWPIFAAMFILLGTPIAFTSLVRRFGGAVPWLKRASDLGPQIACATGAGVTAYLARGPVVYDTQTGWLLALLMMGACVGAARIVSQLRSRMRLEPTYLAGATLGLLATGPAFFSGSVGLTAVCAVIVAGASARAVAREDEPIVTDPEEVVEGLDDDALTELVTRARRPPFQAFGPFERARELLQPELEHHPRVKWLMLQGQRGSGKTSTADALLARLPKSAVILRGACSPPASGASGVAGSEAKPFEVFIKAFRDLGTLGLDEPEEDIFSSIEGRVIGAIPIVSMLLPSGDEEDAAVSDRGELYARMVRELIKQTRRGSRRVVLVLDDVQWLDGASEELLLHLMSVLGPGAEHPISFLLCGRALSDDVEPSPLARRVLGEVEVSVELGDEERREMLMRSIGFDQASAELLDGAVTDREGKSNLGWLLTLVEAVARSGQVVYDEQEGAYRVTVEDGEELPIPENFRKMVGQSYEALGREERELLRVAACLGFSFHLEVVARVVARQRLGVITDLEEVAELTGLVEDDLTSDDVFKFVSTQRYLALREHLSIHEVKPHERQSQLLRDLHLRIARVAEELWRDHQVDIGDVAAHYWAAGQRDLPSALKFCRMAARAARDIFAFDSARFQLRRALTCAELLAKGNHAEDVRREASRASAELDLELRLLPFDEAHVLGRRDLREEQADEAVALFERDVSDGSVDVPLRLLIAMTRACYDARRFDDAMRMAEALVALGDPEAEEIDRSLSEDDLAVRDLAYVEGLHFIGLSLDPRGQAPERLRWLRRAREAVEALDTSDEDRLALQARVFNSLGEQLSQQSTYAFEEARDWFHRSIELKRQLRPEDKPGLARAYGGLGRLYLFRARDEDIEQRGFLVEKARGYFEEDIELCQDYGDVSGECQMHSHLGECALLSERYDDAVASYERSLELAQSPISTGFALIGLIKAQDARQDVAAATEVAARIGEFAREQPLPPFMTSMLADALAIGAVDTDALEELDAVLEALDVDPAAWRAGGEEE